MQKFNTVINGYDKNEVNKFLNEVTKEYESMLNKLKERDVKLQVLEEKLKKFENMESVLNKSIVAAEEAATNVKKVAHDESRLIIEEAKKNASRILNDALIKAEKQELEIDELKRRINFYKRRIREALQEQLLMVDDIDDIKY